MTSPYPRDPARPAAARPLAATPTAATPAAVRPTAATPADSAQAASAAAPTRWVVRWPGFALGTDATAFAALADGRTPGPFRLLRGDGLLATATRTRILGRPDVAAAAGGTALVAGDRTARWATARLATLAARRTSTAALAADARSEWAARRLPPLLRALGPRDATPRALDDAAAFLRSWDGAYAPDAIAPSIFEAWLAAHRAFTGHLPDPADSADVALLPFTLAIARGELADAHGRDPAGWRWGALRGGTSTPVLGRLGGAAGRRYAPAPAGPGGHPTALRPGPALVPDDAPPADSAAADTAGAPRPARLVVSPGPAVWTVWTTLGAARLFVRGPGRADATVSPLDAALGDPGVTVGVDARAPLSARRLLLTPLSARR